ncbi:tetratricopeptide repeat protein [Striga asiatica]|uniref:Tetratricopeptide repeat protein n=1 Tax=Striga asiatica TaxID=4170 RepID=A0A5A7RI89_STRAF|nr:tetratricopeptide repeat protein [Striga asiatica]
MNSSYGNRNNKTDAFDFDLGLGSGRATPMNGQKSHTTPTYSSGTYAQQRPNTTSSWSHQPNKPAWTHQPPAPIQSTGLGSLSGPTSMVGDIFGKSWNSSASSSSSASGIGIVNNNNPNLFGDLLSSAIGQNKSSNNAPLKSSGNAASQNTFQMGSMANSLPKTLNSGNDGKTWGSNVGSIGGNVNLGGNYNKSSSLGGGNLNLGANSTIKPNIGGSSMKNMTGSGIGGMGMGSNKDPFGSLLNFGSKPSAGKSSASKASTKSDLETDSFGDFQSTTSKASGSSFQSFPASDSDPLGDFGFSNNSSKNQTQPPKQSSGANDFDALFSSNEGFAAKQVSGDDDWGVNSEFVGGNDTTTELEGLPPPPVGVSASAAKSKGMDNYKQGQFADAIKWLSWAVILLEKASDDDGTTEVLTCRASCYKEVGEYKKAVADCTKVLEHDCKNVNVLVQRALLYESMEKYKLGAEDLRTVMNIDPGNRVARSTIHRLNKMAG